MRPSEFGSLIDGKNVADLNKGDVIKTFSITITLPSNDDYNGDIIFKVTVDVKVPELPSIVGYNTIDWLETGELARIRPVQFGSESAETYVTYNYDMTTLFRMNNSGVFMNGVVPPATSNQALACRAWSLQFAKDQVTDYEPEFNVSGRPTDLMLVRTMHLLDTDSYGDLSVQPTWFTTVKSQHQRTGIRTLTRISPSDSKAPHGLRSAMTTTEELMLPSTCSRASS